jgi:hypothetical protein
MSTVQDVDNFLTFLRKAFLEKEVRALTSGSTMAEQLKGELAVKERQQAPEAAVCYSV